MATLRYAQTLVGVLIFVCGIPLFSSFYPPVAYRLLVSRRFLYFLASSFLVALTGLICYWFSLIPLNAALMFALPLFQLPLAAVALLTFGKLMNRPPRDVSFNWTRGLLWDRALAAYFFLLIGLSAFLVVGR